MKKLNETTQKVNRRSDIASTQPVTHDERSARAKAQREEREESYRRWVEGASNSLNDCWISASPHATSHDVISHRLLDVIDDIRHGSSIRVPGRFGDDQYVDLSVKQETVRQLYQNGVREAQMVNRARMVRLLRALDIHDVDPDDVEPVLEQPKKNEKLYFLKELKIGNRTMPLIARIAWVRPQDAGKEKASNAKKFTPAACFAGLFYPYRDRYRLVRATGLYPLDVDGLINRQLLEEKRNEIEADETVALLFTSISGTGLRACVLADEAKNAAQYTECYKEIARDKSSAWGVEAQIDDDTSDVCRLCFLPHDPDIFYES